MKLSHMITPDLKRLRREINRELAARVVEITSASTRDELLAAAREVELRAAAAERSDD